MQIAQLVEHRSEASGAQVRSLFCTLRPRSPTGEALGLGLRKWGFDSPRGHQGENMAEIIDLGFCPRCKEDLEGMMDHVWQGIRWCYLCPFDLQEGTAQQRQHWIYWAKEYAREIAD